MFIATLVVAQEIGTSPSAQSLPSPMPSIEYILPYPGILPDHPLYPLKAFRDKLLSILITEPVKRIEFNLLMSDKRLNMAIFLSEKGKESLAESTASKAESYLLSSVSEFAILKTKQQGLTSLNDRLTRAVVKHNEAVTQLKNKTASQYQEGYQGSLNILKTSQEKLQNP